MITTRTIVNIKAIIAISAIMKFITNLGIKNRFSIKDIPDDIINWAIECELSWKPFRIIKQELDFYRKYNIPIPRIHPNQRHINRMNKRNPRKLYDRECQNKNCAEINNTADWKPTKFKTNYSPERKEKVYCKECYEKEII